MCPYMRLGGLCLAWGRRSAALRSPEFGHPSRGNRSKAASSSTGRCGHTLRVQVPNSYILAQNLYHNYYYLKPKYLTIGYMDPLGYLRNPGPLEARWNCTHKKIGSSDKKKSQGRPMEERPRSTICKVGFVVVLYLTSSNCRHKIKCRNGKLKRQALGFRCTPYDILSSHKSGLKFRV